MLARWSPTVELTRLFPELDRLLTSSLDGGRLTPGFHPAIDLYETGDQLVLTALVPSVNPEQLEVSVQQNVLTLAGTFGYDLGTEKATWYRREIGRGQFRESIQLPVPIDADEVSAHFEHGVLKLTMPKAASARPRKIQVQASRATEAIEARSS
jgi:HSP20 family protein